MNSLDAIQRQILTPLELSSLTADGQSWEKVWKNRLPYTRPEKRLVRTIAKISDLELHGLELSKKKVLDVGCGDGTTLKYLNKRYRAYGCGIDISPSAVTSAKRGGIDDDLYFRVADGRALPFPNENFDVVLSWGVMEHAPDFQRYIAESLRVLRPGGRLVLIQPHLFSFAVLQELALRMRGRWPYGKQIDFTYRTLKNMLGQHGFQNILHWSRPAPKDMTSVHHLDLFLHRLWPDWGHYLYILATK